MMELADQYSHIELTFKQYSTTGSVEYQTYKLCITICTILVEGIMGNILNLDQRFRKKFNLMKKFRDNGQHTDTNHNRSP